MNAANSYGTVGACTFTPCPSLGGSTSCSPPTDIAQEHDTFLPQPMQSMRRAKDSKLATWGKLALGAAVGVAGISYCVSVQSSLQAQRDTISLMQQQMCVGWWKRE